MVHRLWRWRRCQVHSRNLGTDVRVYCHRGSIIGANDVGVCPIIRLAVSIRKNDAVGAVRFFREVCNAFDHGVRNGEFRPETSFNEEPCD